MICDRPAFRSRSGTSGLRQGFTLVELLVVIVILGLLVALLSPSLGGAWRAAWRAQCAGNLRYIGEAYGMRAADEVAGRVGRLHTGGWHGILLPYLENNSDVLVCPEDMFTTGGVFSNPEPVASLIRIDDLPRGGGSIALEDTKNVYKMSEAQYQYYWNKGQFNGSRGRHIYNEYQGYVEGGDPDVTWYCIEEDIVPIPEDIWTSRDFEDIRLRIEHLGGGLYSLGLDMGSGFGGVIVRQDTEEVLYRLPGYIDSEGKGHGWNRYTRGNLIDLGTLYAAGGECSYGMNQHARDIKGVGDKILVMDYCKALVKTTDNWAAENYDLDADETPDFARHFGEANVLLSDGSVRSFAPYEIDPVIPSAAQTWWEP